MARLFPTASQLLFLAGVQALTVACAAGTQAVSSEAPIAAPDGGSFDDDGGPSGLPPEEDAGSLTPGAPTAPDAGPLAQPDAAPPPAPPTPVPPVADAASPDARSPGEDAAAPTPPTSDPALPIAGDIVISEVMYNPSDTTDTDGEWIELYNGAADTKLLSGLTLADGSGHSHTIASNPAIVIAPASYVLLVHNAAELTTYDAVPASVIAYEYSDITLANGSTGAISISNGGTLLASVPYGPWGLVPSGGGASIQLSSLTAADDSTATSFCVSLNSWAAGSDYGTPGAPSDCP